MVPETDPGVFWDRLLLDDAIIVDPVAGDPDVRAIQALGLPCVTVGRHPDAPEEGYRVDNDAEAATRLCLDHLASRGARSVAAITWMTTDYWTQASIRIYHAWCVKRPRGSSAQSRAPTPSTASPSCRPCGCCAWRPRAVFRCRPQSWSPARLTSGSEPPARRR